jgi:hypothetical protein
VLLDETLTGLDHTGEGNAARSTGKRLSEVRLGVRRG